MTDARATRVVDGHRYELIHHYVDPGLSGPHDGLYIIGSWELLRDGEPVTDSQEAMWLYREYFGGGNADGTFTIDDSADTGD